MKVIKLILVLLIIFTSCKKDGLEIEEIINTNDTNCSSKDIIINVDSFIENYNPFFNIINISLCKCDTVNFYSINYNIDSTDIQFIKIDNNSFTYYYFDSLSIEGSSNDTLGIGFDIITFDSTYFYQSFNETLYLLLYNDCP